MVSKRLSRESGHRRKFLVVVDETPECERAAAYAAIDDLDAPTLFHRTDIAARAAAGEIPTPTL